MTTFWIIFLTILAAVFMGLFAASQMNLSRVQEENEKLLSTINNLRVVLGQGEVSLSDFTPPDRQKLRGDGHILYNTQGEQITPLNLPHWGMIEIHRDELLSSGERHWKYAYLTEVIRERRELFPNEIITLYVEPDDVLRLGHRVYWDIQQINNEGTARD